MSDEQNNPKDHEAPAHEAELESEQDQPGGAQAGGGEVDQVAELREALLRTRAEMDNLEKRTQRELEKARKFMFEGIFKDLLPVIDGLDQGLEATGGEGSPDGGLALTRKLLLQTLERHGLALIDPVGEAFDPEWHEAMSAQPNAEVAPETILVVLQKGYQLNDRLLRPARVVISSEAS